jgi:hypothetical protein
MRSIKPFSGLLSGPPSKQSLMRRYNGSLCPSDITPICEAQLTPRQRDLSAAVPQSGPLGGGLAFENQPPKL